MKEVIEAARQITALEIQGATNIAMFAVKELVKFAQRNKSLSKKEMWTQLVKVEEIFTKSRSTEPGMRNGLMYILGKLQHDQSEGISEDIPKMIEIYGSEYENILKEAKKSIAQYGNNLIPNNLEKPYIIQTHCHSSIVEAILIEAHNQGKNFIVVATETRPFYQGRITAKKLTDAGIKVIQVVDSAMRWVANKFNSDIIIIGADAITSEGTVLNKIGSRLLALVAKEMHIPLYVASPLLKYNPGTAFGNYEKIEMRETKEIWKDWADSPKDLTYLNPAFETINRVYISGVITEAGIFPSGQVHMMFSKIYPFLHEAYRLIEHGSSSDIF